MPRASQVAKPFVRLMNVVCYTISKCIFDVYLTKIMTNQIALRGGDKMGKTEGW